MNHNSFTPLTLQADPQLLSCSRSLSLPPPSPSLPWFGLLSLRVLPFGFSLSFYFHPCPSLFFLLSLSLTSILPARPRACSHFRRELKRVVTRWCVCVFVCLLCMCWASQLGVASHINLLLTKPVLAKAIQQ